MTTKHTKGPWSVSQTGKYVRLCIPGTVLNICKMEINGDEEANARLIAAAPSLYDSAQAVLEWARTPGHHSCNPYSLPFVREAEIALAQAEGRAPENWAQRITSNTPSKV